MSEWDTRLVIDVRWNGAHGIGRYSHEVLSRLPAGYRRLDRGEPTNNRDAINLDRLRLSRNDLLYSPGYRSGLSRCRQLLTVMDLIHLHPSTKAPPQVTAYYEHIIKPAIRRLGHVMTISQTSADALAEWLSDDRVTIHDAGLGCSPVFSPAGPVHAHPRPYVLCVSNMKPHKNVATVMQAMAMVPGADLVLVTPDRDQTLAAAAQLGVADRCLHIGGVSDEQLAEIYRGAALLAYPSLVEGFGLPALEASNCGRPIVYAEECRSVAELLDGSGLGVTAATDPATWSEALNAALASPPPLFTSGAARYTWDATALKVREAINQCLVPVS
jgi:glycosyltransferase involved in cell wall biosynthesis